MAFTPIAPVVPSETLEETSLPSIKHLKTQLHFDDDSLFGNEALLLPKKQPVQVYLRLRPMSDQERELGETSCLEVCSDHLLLAHPPEYSHTYKSTQKGLCVAKQRFIFSHIYDGACNQKELFHDGILPTITDFFDGQNCLIFSYGVTNSGKTYTVTGTSEQPGILPRTLDVVFNSVKENQFGGTVIKPKHYQEAVYLTEEQQEEERNTKNMLMAKSKELLLANLNKCSENSASHESSVTSHESIAEESSITSNMTQQGLGASCLDDIAINESTTVTLDTATGTCFSIWISFAEIYNEFIYDLLADSVLPNKQRSALKLAEDRHHNFFIKDLTEIKVDNVEEAISLLRVGLHYRHTAETRLNYASSRSHSVFTIKLLRVAQGCRRPKVTRVNRISIVDLAGSERSSKTFSEGTRIKEAGSINRSLHTLGRCIEAMRHNQRVTKKSERKLVPFRESKLTQLLQGYFVGKGTSAREGRIVMFVNASDVGSTFDETVIVLRFSAIASQVVPITKVASTSLVRASVPSPMRPDADEDATPTNPNRAPIPSCTRLWGEGTEQKEDIPCAADPPATPKSCCHCKILREKLADVQAQLENNIRTKKSEIQFALWEREVVIRQQVSQEFNQQIVELEERYTREIEEAEERIDDEMEKRMRNLHQSMKKQFPSKKRRLDGGEDRSDLGARCTHLEKEVAELCENLELQEEKAANELKELHQTHTTRMVHLREQMNRSVIECGEAKLHLQELEKQVLQQQAAKEEWLKEKQELLDKLDSQKKHFVAKLEQEMANNEKARKELLTYAEEQESHDQEKEELLLQIIGLESQLKVKVENETRQSQVEEEQVLNYKQKIEESSATITQLQNELRTRSEQLEALQRKSEEQCAKAIALKAEYDQLGERKANELEEVQSRLRSELSAAELLYREQIELKATDMICMQEELKIKSEQLEAVKEELVVEREEVAVLKSRVDQLTKDKASLASQVDDLMEEVDETKRQFARKNLEQAELQDSSRSLLEDELSTIKKKYALLEKEVEDRKRQGEEAIERKEEEMLSVKEKLNVEVSHLKAEASRSESHIKELSATLASIQEDCAKELTQKNNALELAERRSAVAEAQIRELTKNLDTARDEHIQELEEQEKMFQKSESRIHEMENELKENRSKQKLLHLEKDKERRKIWEEFCQEKARLQEQIRFKEEELTQVMGECKEAKVKEAEAIRYTQKLEKMLDKMRQEQQQQQQLEKAQSQQQEEVVQELSLEKEGRENPRKSAISTAISIVKPTLCPPATSNSSHCHVDSEHIYEEPPDQRVVDSLIYDSVDTSTCTTMQDDLPANQNEISGRHLRVLERSSQLIDSFEDFEASRRVIVYNPLKDAKQFKEHNKKNSKRVRLETTATGAPADCGSETPVAASPTRYMLRSRKKRREEEVVSDDENTTPLSKLGRFFQPRSRTEGKVKKPVSIKTRQKLRKSQISAPLETIDMDTPKTKLRSRAKIKIGGSVRPSTRQRNNF